MNEQAGKTVLITGASSGIGKSFAQLLAAEGANLILVARREERLKEIASELATAYSISVEVIAKDLGQAGSAQALYDEVQGRGLSVDTLINNAGIGKQGDYLDESLESHHQVMQLNVISLNDLTYLFAQDMVAKGSGNILLVASIASFMPIPKFATYAATKAYVLTLGESLAAELKDKGVIVTTLCPGGTLTEFMENSGQQIDGLRNLAMMSSDQVAQEGLTALQKGKRVIVPGWLYKFSIAGLRLVPRRLQAVFGQMATD